MERRERAEAREGKAVNPYILDTPAVVSFSGGRTSGFMLRNVIDAFGGKLPEDVAVVFANTGLEHPKTYEFIEAVENNWGVPIHWVEYRSRNEVVEVRPETASRNGEPFEALILDCNYLPNPVTRKCTTELKIRSMRRYLVRERGWNEYTNAIGLRADEPRRVARIRGDVKAEHTATPMATAGHTLPDVLAFWKSQPFDLELPGGDNAFGNCVGCFLKGRGKILRLMRHEPEHFAWWAHAETLPIDAKSPAAHVFRSDRPTYAQLLETARTQGILFDEFEEDTIPCACTD